MAGSAEEVREQQAVADAADEENEAAFDEGFNGEPTGETPPADAEKPAKTDAEEGNKPEGDTAQASAKKPESSEPEYVQITKAQLEQLMGLSTQIESVRADAQKNLDKAFGKVGGLERILNDLRSATPAGITVEVSDDIVADIREEFPELGEKTLSAFKKFAAKLKGTGAQAAPFDTGQVVSLVDERARQLQRDILSIKHEDWETIVGLPDAEGKVPDTEYRRWLAKQPQEVRDRLANSWDARAIAKSIDQFKADAKKANDEAAEAARAAAAKATAKPAPSARKRALEAAASPRGEGGRPAAPTEEDEFQAGFDAG